MTKQHVTWLMCYECGSERKGEVVSDGMWRCDLCYTIRPLRAGAGGH